MPASRNYVISLRSVLPPEAVYATFYWFLNALGDAKWY